MKSKTDGRFVVGSVRVAFVGALVVGGTLAPLACGGSAPAQGTQATTTLGSSSSHAIHVFITQPDGTKQRADFGQGTEVSFGGKRKSSNALSRTLRRPQPLGGIVSDSGTPLSTPPTIDDPGTEITGTAWELVARAAAACNAWGSLPPWGAGEYDDGLSASQWYVFPTPTPLNCADRVALEQDLVCIADKLAEVADAVSDVTWPALAGACSPGPSGSYVYGSDDGGVLGPTSLGCAFRQPWDIPPQANGDRFIVRDLAIHTLGMIPVMDSYDDILAQTCSTTFAQVASGALALNPATDTTTPYEIFGVIFGSNLDSPIYPSFPPSTVPFIDAQGNDNMPAIALSALAIESQILRSGGRLLHDLVRRDVYSDMASAAQQSAQALDPGAGSQAEWGLGPQGQYGSIAHAARVLLGRWEIGDQADFPTTYQPACEGVSAIDLVTGAPAIGSTAAIPSAFGADLSARISDLPIRTPGEATASNFVETAGIVVPSCAMSNTSGLRTALIDQLLLDEQVRDGMTVNLQSSERTAYANALSSSVVSDAELTFAFERALATYRLLTNGGDITATGSACQPLATPTADPTTGALIDLPAGLKTIAPVSGVSYVIAPSIGSVQGIVIAGGIARSHLTTDPMARVGGMSEASQCAESPDDDLWSPWGVAQPAAATQSPYSLPREDFQDAFHMAQAFEHRLVLIEAASNTSAITQSALLSGGANSNPEAVARGGIAEMRTWAGSATIHATPTAPDSGPLNLQVEVAGMAYSDFGVAAGISATSAVQGAFGFVYGPPWVAECAVHARTDCPANFDTTYVQHPTAVVDNSGASTMPAYAAEGAVDTVFELTVPIDPTDTTRVASFQPPAAVLDDGLTPNASHLYMVRVSAPSSPGGQGYVIGTIPLRYRLGITCGICKPNYVYETFSLVDAPMQRELVHDAIDLGTWVGAAPPALGDQSAAQMSGYCVDGVPRDLFVPLDNELTSDNSTYEDSWQVYLGLAQTAAQTADTLGQQLIANDLQISENQQAASEQLANLCGDFGVLSSVSVNTDGTMTGGASDQSTSSCLQTQTTDVVFIGQPPADMPKDAASQSAYLKSNILRCGGAGASDQLCNVTTRPLTWDYLGIAPAPPSSSADCQALGGYATSARTSFQGTKFFEMLQDAPFSTGAMQALAIALQMQVDFWNNWQVVYSGQVIMSSFDADYWPACLSTGNGCAGLPATDLARATYLNDSFRWCPNATGEAALLKAPLGCDGAINGGDPVAAELNVIKWRVMQALWMVAMSAGDMNPGMFQMPVPVVSYGPAQNGTAFPVSTFYSEPLSQTQTPCLNGWYQVGATSTALCLNQWNLTTGAGGAPQTDVSAMANTFDVAPQFGAFTAHANSEIPTWYRSLYASGTLGQVKHRWVENDDEIFPNCYYSSIQAAVPAGQCGLPPRPAGTPNNSYPLALSALVAQGSTSLDNLTCANPFGESPTGTPSRAGFPLWQWVATAKAGLDIDGQDFEPFVFDGAGSIQSDGAGHSAFTCNGCGPPSSQYTTPFCSSGSQGLWDCAVDEISGDFTSPGQQQISTQNPSSPALAPWQRTPAFIGMNVPNGTCAAVAQLLQPAALACAAQDASLSHIVPTQPPQISTISDIVKLNGWLGLTSSIVSQSVGLLYAEKIPQQVVADFKSNQVGTGNTAGSRGQSILDMEQAMSALPGAWVRIASGLAEAQTAIKTADLAVNAAQLSDDATIDNLALQELQLQGQLAAQTVAFMGTILTSGAQAGQSDGTSYINILVGQLALDQSVQSSNAQMAQINQEMTDANKIAANQIAQAMNQLSATTIPIWSAIQTALDDIRSTTAQVMKDAQQLQLIQGQAQYQAAVGTGADFVTIAGEEVPIPVDTVLRRQASATEQRYQTALVNAKALAYMARRAIEQRIGVTLDALTVPVGPLAAPASWADDICSLQGVNYAALSTGAQEDAGGIGGTADQQAISQFADAWVGDYVAKLQNFVTYYNAQYPSHQGEDTAVVSLRYDLMPATTCNQQGPNLLLNSGELDALTTTGAAPGWDLPPCAPGTGKCLAVLPGNTLVAPQDGPAGASASPSLTGVSANGIGVSWLVDETQTANGTGTTADAGATDGGTTTTPDAGTSAAWPAGAVSQAATLQPGTYVLSWWDQARDGFGNVWSSTTTQPVAYVVNVYGPDGTSVTSFTASPFAPTGVEAGTSPSLWSARNVLTFTVAQSGTYRIAFGASLPGGTSTGSVAIAQVQLEVAGATDLPTTYVGTGNSLSVPSTNCTPSDSDFRAAFQHNCNSAGVCSYDLVTPLLIDTGSLNAGTSSLGAKLAQGNFNYRHETLALNLVGTGVHDCSNDPSPNCYGSGYIEYDLQHDATNAGIIDYNGNVRVFDFGTATVNHGKALAAEQYITMPVSSADQTLIEQPGIEHEEFSGRPLDGAYTLRIWDSPDLDWSALEDVQIVFNYEYWSAIQVSGNTGDAHRPLIGHRPFKAVPRVLKH